VDGLNIYGFVRNSPIFLRDRSGENAEDMAAGKAWERQVFDMVNKKIPIVEQVTVKAIINGKTVESVLDALGRDEKGWVALESKLNPATELTPNQILIREHLSSGGEVTISATDKAKIAEIRNKLKVGPNTLVSTSRYEIVNQANVSAVLSELNVIPKGHGTILHSSGELTVHTPDEMKRIQAIMEQHPRLDMKSIVQKAQETTVSSETLEKVGKGGKQLIGEVGEGFVKRGAKYVGRSLLKMLPLFGAAYTLFGPGEASAEERVGRAIAGEIGIGPIDLETYYDFAMSMAPIVTEAEQRRYEHMQRYGTWRLGPGSR
jgi:hypothetical protein